MAVQARISVENPKAIYVHCFSHSLNLAVQDTSKRIALIRNTLDVIQEISNLICFSPKCKALLERIKDQFHIDGPSLRPLSPTRWTVKAKSLESVLSNYHNDTLVETFHVIEIMFGLGINVQTSSTHLVVTSRTSYYTVSLHTNHALPYLA